jgi:hypothetical protein
MSRRALAFLLSVLFFWGAGEEANWCLVGPQAAPLREQLAALGVVTAAMHLFVDIGHVQTEMGAHALPGDLLALIDIDATRRLGMRSGPGLGC